MSHDTRAKVQEVLCVGGIFSGAKRSGQAAEQRHPQHAGEAQRKGKEPTEPTKRIPTLSQ